MRSKLNKGQIKLIQVAARAARIRTEFGDGRYRLLLANYKKPSGGPCTSCKDLDFDQMEDFLAVCESMGFRMPGKSETYFRDKVAMRQVGDGDRASSAQLAALRHLRDDLGWSDTQFRGMIERMTQGRKSEMNLNRRDAWNLIEAMKAMVMRMTGIKPGNLKQIQESMEANDGTDPNR